MYMCAYVVPTTWAGARGSRQFVPNVCVEVQMLIFPHLLLQVHEVELLPLPLLLGEHLATAGTQEGAVLGQQGVASGARPDLLGVPVNFHHRTLGLKPLGFGNGVFAGCRFFVRLVEANNHPKVRCADLIARRARTPANIHNAMARGTDTDRLPHLGLGRNGCVHSGGGQLSLSMLPTFDDFLEGHVANVGCVWNAPMAIYF